MKALSLVARAAAAVPSNPVCVWNEAYQENYQEDTYAEILQFARGCYVLVDPFGGGGVGNNPIEKIAEIKSYGNTVGCYISVGTCEGWRDDFSAIREYCVETADEWDDEYFVYDLAGIVPYMEQRIDSIAAWGCDFVEFGNMDWCTDGDNRGNYGSDPESELPQPAECAKYNGMLCTYAQDNGVLCMAKNTGYTDDESQWAAGDLMDAVTFESYRDEFNWWDDSHLQGFLDNDKPVVIVHYDAGSDYNSNSCDFVFNQYRARYGNTDKISFICESRAEEKYLHFDVEGSSMPQMMGSARFRTRRMTKKHPDERTRKMTKQRRHVKGNEKFQLKHVFKE